MALAASSYWCWLVVIFEVRNRRLFCRGSSLQGLSRLLAVQPCGANTPVNPREMRGQASYMGLLTAL